jgi:hypothetical protein
MPNAAGFALPAPFLLVITRRVLVLEHVGGVVVVVVEVGSLEKEFAELRLSH